MVTCACWHKNASLCEKCLVIVFRYWGKFVASHPIITIILSSIIAGSTIYFAFDIETEDGIEELYVPKHTESWNNQQKYKETWARYDTDDYRSSNIIFTKHNKNVYNINDLLNLQTINDLLENNLTFTYNQKTYNYKDICYKQENKCYTRCILEFYNFNSTIIKNRFSINKNDTNSITYPYDHSIYFDELVGMPQFIGQTPQLITIRHTLNNDSIFGNNSILKSTPAFSCEYATDETLYSYDMLVEWEYAFTQYLNNYNTKHSEYRISHYADSSFDDEFSRAIGTDTTSFIEAFVCLAVFAIAILFRCHRQKSCCNLLPFSLNMSRSRALMGIIGIISSSLAVGSAFGIVGGLLRIPFNPVVSVSPFLLVGLGVDDMFVLLRSYDLTDHRLSIQNRIILTLERGGISILFTSLTDLVAFCVGSTSRFQAVSAFCVYCGVGVFLDFIFQCSFFLGFMVLDSRWQSYGSCKTQTLNEPLYDEEKDDHDHIDDDIMDEVKSNDNDNNNGGGSELITSVLRLNEPNDFDYNLPNSASSSLSYIFYNKRSINELEEIINTKSASKVMQILGDLLLYNNKIKCCTLFLFALYIAGAVYGILSLETYQDPIDLMPNDSYLRDYYNDVDQYFNAFGDSMMFSFDKPLDYSNRTILETINEFTDKVEHSKCFQYPQLTQSWIKDYQLALKEYNMTNFSSTEFYVGLFSVFLASEDLAYFKNDIWTTVTNPNYQYNPFNNDYGNVINRSRIWVQMIPTGSGTGVLTDCLSSFKELTAEYHDSLGVYYWEYMTIYSESDKIVLQQTIYNLMYAIIASFIITIILIPYPLMSIFVMITVAQILLGILGYMSLWGLPINTNTMINVVISVGFSVDNAAHICHSYMNAPINNIKGKQKLKGNKKQERKLRILYALNAVGMPILCGDLSTVIAILPLARAQSEIFTSFFKVLFLVMLFGICHAVLFLPVVLSIIGPTSLSSSHIVVKNPFNKNSGSIQLDQLDQLQSADILEINGNDNNAETVRSEEMIISD